MDRVDVIFEAVEVIAGLAILGAWIAGEIETEDPIGQVVVLVALVAIFGDAAIKVIRARMGQVENGV